MCSCRCSTWSLIREQVRLFGEMESSGAGDTSCCGSFHDNRTQYMPWQSHWARRGERSSVFARVCVCVCFCVQLCECICVGLCQEMAELSGMRCLLHSLAVGVNIMRVTEGCLCVGECFSALCVYIYICNACVSVCVWERASVSSKCTIICSVCQFSMVTKGGYSGYSLYGSEKCPEAPKHH